MENTNVPILYIDDEDVNLRLFDASFSRYYQVHVAYSTEDAEKLTEQIQFKVIITDISMPKENGLDFIKRFKRDDYNPIFIILTAYVNDHFLLDALNQGRIFRYLLKPWKTEEIKLTIDQAVQIFDLQVKNKELYQDAIESRQNFSNIFQASQDAIVIFNREGTILEANAAFINNFNNQSDLTAGKNLYEFLPRNLHSKLENTISQIDSSGTSRVEFEYKTSPETTKVLDVVCSKLEFKGGPAFMAIIHDLTEHKQNEQKILNAVIQAEEKERSRLAKDLHDGLGPVMATLKMYLEWLNDRGKIDEHPDILFHALTSTTEAITTLKNISNNLSPHVLERFGIVPALSSYIDKMKQVSPVKFNLSLTLNERLPVSTEMSVYRIITECITNTLRHAEATEISLSLKKINNYVTLQYSDNGKGFDINEMNMETTGMGLSNMRNRIKTLGGKIEIHSQPGYGILIQSEIPIN